MRDQTRIITNTLVTYAARVVAGVVGLYLVRFMLHELGDEAYGVIGIANSILQFIVLIELGVRPAAARQFTRFLADREIDRANALASSALAVYGAMGLLVLAAVLVAGPAFLGAMQVAPGLADEALLALTLVAISVGVTLVGAPYDAALASRLRYDVAQYNEAIGWLLRAAIIVGGFAIFTPHVWIWAAAALAATLVAFFVNRWQAHRVCPELELARKRMTRAGLRDLAGFGAWVSVLRFAGWLSNTSGALIVSALLGPASVAHFTPAITLVFALQPLTRAFLAQLVPVITRAEAAGDRDLSRRILLRSTRYALVAGGATLVAVGTVARPLIELWLGPGYEDTARVLEYWCANGVLQACVGAAFPLFLGTGQLRAMAALNTLLAVGTVAGGIYLVGWTDQGIAGAAAAALGTQAIRSVAYVIQCTRILGLSPWKWLRESFVGPGVALAVLLGVSLAVQAALARDDALELFAALVCAGLVFAPLAWWLGLVREDRVLVTDTLRSAVARLARRPRPDKTGD